MILLNRPVFQMSDMDIAETLVYCRWNLSSWKDFRSKSEDFQMRQTADNNILICERKITELTQNLTK
jgi:hypothetical protein